MTTATAPSYRTISKALWTPEQRKEATLERIYWRRQFRKMLAQADRERAALLGLGVHPGIAGIMCAEARARVLKELRPA